MNEQDVKPYDILVVGEINPDLILSDPNLSVNFGQYETLASAMTLTIGSSSAIFACGAARLGLRVGFVGVSGDDPFGRFMLDAMQSRSIDTSLVIVDPAVPTGLSVILSRGVDRAIITYPGSIAALKAGQVSNSMLQQARHLHIASYFLQTGLQAGLPDLLRRAREFGLTISLDTNWDPSEEWHGIEELLRLVDVFLPNRNEAMAIAGANEINEALNTLSRFTPLISVKLGEQGAIARQGGEIVSAPFLPVNVVDTVGAGDTFDAGFIYGYLNGWALERSLRFACICGSRSTEAAGGMEGQPTLEQALAILELT